MENKKYMLDNDDKYLLEKLPTATSEFKRKLKMAAERLGEFYVELPFLFIHDLETDVVVLKLKDFIYPVCQIAMDDTTIGLYYCGGNEYECIGNNGYCFGGEYVENVKLFKSEHYANTDYDDSDESFVTSVISMIELFSSMHSVHFAKKK